jgi:large subunit ribosomal protein L24
MKLHAGDTVVVISGKDKGKTGRIMRVLLLEDRVIVAGVNMRTRHLKKTPQTPGRKVQYEASIHASNVALLDPKLKKPTRIGYRLTSDGKKERFAKRSKESLVSGRKLRALVEENLKKEEKSEKMTSLREDKTTSAPATS